MESIAALVVAVITAMWSGFNTLISSSHKKETKKDIEKIISDQEKEIAVLKIEYKNTQKNIDLIRDDIKQINKKLDRLLEKGK